MIAYGQLIHKISVLYKTHFISIIFMLFSVCRQVRCPFHLGDLAPALLDLPLRLFNWMEEMVVVVVVVVV